jgi:polar amino acid transport system substrate-binding protein
MWATQPVWNAMADQLPDRQRAGRSGRQAGLTALFCLAAHVAGAELPLCPDHPISFAFYQMGWMYNSAEAPGQKAGRGIDRDLLDELMRRSGCHFDVTTYARARTWHELERGTLDMASAAAETPARSKFAWFAFYMIGKQYLVLRRPTAAVVHTMDELYANPQLRLGVVRSFAHGPYFDDFVAKFRAAQRLDEFVDQDALYQALIEGKVSAIFGLPFVYPYYVSKYQLGDKLQALDLDPSPGLKHGIVMSKHSFSEADAVRWRALVDEIRNDGTMRRIISKYLDPQVTEAVMKF